MRSNIAHNPFSFLQPVKLLVVILLERTLLSPIITPQEPQEREHDRDWWNWQRPAEAHGAGPDFEVCTLLVSRKQCDFS